MDGALARMQPGFIEQLLDFLVGHGNAQNTIIEVCEGEPMVGDGKVPAVDSFLHLIPDQFESILGYHPSNGHVINKDIWRIHGLVRFYQLADLVVSQRVHAPKRTDN